MYNKKNIPKLKETYKSKININFHSDGVPNEGFHCICLLVILIDSFF